MVDFTERANEYLRLNQIDTRTWGNSPVVFSRAIMTRGNVYSVIINFWFVRLTFAIDVPDKLARVWNLHG